MRKLSQERQDVLDLLRREGPKTPSSVAQVLPKSRPAVKKLMYSMLADDQLVALGGGLYGLPQTETVTDAARVTDQIEPVTEMPKITVYKPGSPVTGEGMFAFSVLDGGMIPYEELRRRKGYPVEERP